MPREVDRLGSVGWGSVEDIETATNRSRHRKIDAEDAAVSTAAIGGDLAAAHAIHLRLAAMLAPE